MRKRANQTKIPDITCAPGVCRNVGGRSRESFFVELSLTISTSVILLITDIVDTELTVVVVFIKVKFKSPKIIEKYFNMSKKQHFPGNKLSYLLYYVIEMVFIL